MFVRVKTQDSVSQLIKECSRLHGDGCARMDVTEDGAKVTVEPGMLEAVVRDNLNITARRDVVVTQPLKLTEVGRREKRDITVPDFPNSQTRGTHDQSSISISH